MGIVYKSEYIDTAKALPKGGHTYIPHEGCTPNAKMWVYSNQDGWGAYCNKCGDKGFTPIGTRRIQDLRIQWGQEEEVYSKDVSLPDDFCGDVSKWPQEALLWLYKSDIRNQLIHAYNIGYSKSHHRVIIPVYDQQGKLRMWQGRGLHPSQTKYLNLADSSKNDLFYTSWAWTTPPKQKERLVVVEDALSVIRVGRYIPTVACMGTSISQKQYNMLSEWHEVVFWFDEDSGGWNGSNKAIRKLSLVTDCYRVRTEDDPKTLSNDEIKKALNID